MRSRYQSLNRQLGFESRPSRRAAEDRESRAGLPPAYEPAAPSAAAGGALPEAYETGPERRAGAFIPYSPEEFAGVIADEVVRHMSAYAPEGVLTEQKAREMLGEARTHIDDALERYEAKHGERDELYRDIKRLLEELPRILTHDLDQRATQIRQQIFKAVRQRSANHDIRVRQQRLLRTMTNRYPAEGEFLEQLYRSGYIDQLDTVLRSLSPEDAERAVHILGYIRSASIDKPQQLLGFLTDRRRTFGSSAVMKLLANLYTVPTATEQERRIDALGRSRNVHTSIELIDFVDREYRKSREEQEGGRRPRRRQPRRDRE